ncbi:hypothetical protein Q2380_08115 [Enterobacter hormaechei]|uniref:hypothetical protein n=1 Tax=Enterobacter hormaechei TaxID=158836 RepID=UPI0026669B89|nr:hypothetical protein [Enterobacter hormaechei]MDO2397739.1 hypothetical protein [Enterobacter hormaechei]MDO2403034.1 hypothetical protein [Enterobacter hormaechei]MDO2417262.1 hypothetical protein [Enterobacter hormaechei]MDO2426978.1 hypothetical protein [Enterobacter hormaechei]
MKNNNYQQLTRTFQRLSRFSHLSSIASWDMFTMMPPGGSAARGEALAEMSVLQHQILNDKKVGEWLAAAAEEDLNDVEQANLREMTRHYQQATLLPESLVEAKSLAGSRCEHAWRTQRPANDWQGFSANLKEVVKLSREEARLRAEAKGCTPYDALLDIFEPDMTSARLDVLFGDLKSWLPELLAKVVEKQAQRSFVPPQGPFPTATQRVKPGYIRVDADEVSYPAHVVLRYEIERALINGEIEVDDIPALWDEKMQAWLGLSTKDNYRNGCMQDIHWTDGGFGYFPSYTLGAMYAAQLFHAAKTALPGLQASIAGGDFSALFDWLRQNIWQHGSRFSTSQLITQATGEDLNIRYFREHLTSRYL